MARRVDTHQHFWNLDLVEYSWLKPEDGVLYRTYGPQELEPQLRSVGIDFTVLVQSANSYADTSYMLAKANEYDWIGAVIGWVPLWNPPEAAYMLDNRFGKNSKFRGVRHLIHDEQDPDWVVQEQVIAGLRELEKRNMVFEVVAVFPNHLKHVPTLAQELPNLSLVIDHLAKPPIKMGDDGAWARQMEEAACYPNVYAKVSGLNTAADWQTWSAADLKPFIERAIDQFGPERLMFGSDWPVALLAGDYQRVWEETKAALSDYSSEVQDAILGETAIHVYRISEKQQVQRFGQLIRVKPEEFSEYARLHADAWPKVLEIIRKCNIRNYSIFHKDNMLFAYFEYCGEDFEQDMARMAADPVTQEWWNVVKPMQEPLATRREGEWWADMEEVFHTD